MKIINFISALTPHHHKELNRWYQFSVSLCAITIIAIALLTTHTLLILKNIKSELSATTHTAQAYHQLMEKKQALGKQETVLNEQLNTIASWHHSTVQSTHLLHAIEQNMGDSGLMESVTLSTNKMLLTILCNNTDDAMHIINTLKNISDLKNLTLVSLQPKQYAEQNILRVNMKAHF